MQQKIIASMPRVLIFPGLEIFLFITKIGIILIRDSVFAVLIRNEQLSPLLFFQASDIFVHGVRVRSILGHVRHRSNQHRWDNHFPFRLCHAKRRFCHSTSRHFVHHFQNCVPVRLFFRVAQDFDKIFARGRLLEYIF